MSRPRIGSSAAYVALALAVLLAPAGLRAGGSPGLARYLDRHDRKATALLADELDTGAVEPQVALALGDLAFMRRDFATARRALDLAASLGAEPSASQARVWLAWVDFEAGDRAAAEGRLRHLTGTAGSSVVADEARFTLGWQQLLAGRYPEAATTFAALAASTDGHWLAFPDSARLLEGQARLWSGDLDAAEDTLRRLIDDYPSSPLTDDALRDLAWSAHLRGDDARARRLLTEVVTDYRAAHFTSEGLPIAPWSAVVAHGPRALAKPIWRAYRRRPRGEPPLEFLLRVGNRSAADDARQLLDALATGAPAEVVATDTEGAPPVRASTREQDPARPPQRMAHTRVEPAPRAASGKTVGAVGTLMLLVLVLVSSVAARLLRRRGATTRRGGRT